MSIARVRVELRNYNPNADRDERERAFRGLHAAFKKACMDAGIQREYRLHENFESNSERRRRKAREAEVQVLKQKLRESFSERKKERN